MKTIEQMKEMYIKFRTISNRKPLLNTGLALFFKTLNKNYPNTEYLTQEMLDNWCVKKDTESAISYQTRYYHVASFIKHAINNRWITLNLPQSPKPSYSTYTPHFITNEELKNFFKSCDEINSKPFHYNSEKQISRQALVSVEVPVFYRLMYSTGMRPPEVRCLLREDLNFSTGEVHVHNTKGYNEHILVLHDTMLKLMVQYDAYMNKIKPRRTYMFPDENDNCYNAAWQNRMFQTHWKKYNDTKCVAYCFRHNYAIENINKIIHRGMEANEELVALSRSMGHASLKETMHYYSLVPRFGKELDEISAVTLDDLLPEINGYEK